MNTQRRISVRDRVLGLGALALLASGCGAPQIGHDRQVFHTVDALYTAVQLRDASLLDQDAASLTALHQSGQLPEAAHRDLEAIIAEARRGAWEPARRRLRDFMLGQRR
jgi:hypothetical protein